MEEKEQIIPYRSVPRWVVPAVSSTCAASALAIIFMTSSVALLICPGLPHASLIVVETFVRAVGVLLCALFAFLAYELARNDRLIIGKSGLVIPLFLAPHVLFRRKRGWDDVANVLLGHLLLEDKKGTYEYELESGPHQKKLFIYFKSGGHVALDLTKMPRQSNEILFKAVESFCFKCHRSPQSKGDLEIKPRKKIETKQQAVSYTQIWEDELLAHFSATNFVPLEKGRTLQSDKYAIVMQLSSGGLSAIYLAETANKELVVVKEAVLPPTLSEQSRQKAKEMFRREALILRELDHPRIAKVLDYFVERGRDYLIIEFVPGENLRQVVKKRGTQSERVVLNVAKQTTEILDYLHDRKPPVVHRDITPDNLMLKENGDVVLIDFGAANQYVGTATGTLVGKQCYIAPEQFKGKANIQSDYYSLGCTLYFLLTAQDPEALSTSHPHLTRGDIMEELDSLVADLTAINLKDRIHDTTELLDRIDVLTPDTVLSFSASESS